MTLQPRLSLPEKLAAQAESIVNTLTRTDYQYDEDIDAAAGIYDCDCNSFVGFVVEEIAPRHYALIPKESDQPRPRAFKYHDYFESLAATPAKGWEAVACLIDARRGDIIAWRAVKIEAGKDTGHVIFVGDTPKIQSSGAYAVRVYDSADKPHFEDTRGEGDSGVGSGFINFKVNADGAPVSFQFSPSASFVTLPIAIGRITPL